MIVRCMISYVARHHLVAVVEKVDVEARESIDTDTVTVAAVVNIAIVNGSIADEYLLRVHHNKTFVRANSLYLSQFLTVYWLATHYFALFFICI